MRPGSTQRTAAGVVRIETVDEVDPGTLTGDDAARSGTRSHTAGGRTSADRSGTIGM
jgi:hypothetical protein